MIMSPLLFAVYTALILIAGASSAVVVMLLLDHDLKKSKYKNKKGETDVS